MRVPPLPRRRGADQNLLQNILFLPILKNRVGLKSLSDNLHPSHCVLLARELASSSKRSQPDVIMDEHADDVQDDDDLGWKTVRPKTKKRKLSQASTSQADSTSLQERQQEASVGSRSSSAIKLPLTNRYRNIVLAS